VNKIKPLDRVCLSGGFLVWGLMLDARAIGVTKVPGVTRSSYPVWPRSFARPASITFWQEIMTRASGRHISLLRRL